jgi:CubicO group peptidase (beta-lactamase class C family)
MIETGVTRRDFARAFAGAAVAAAAPTPLFAWPWKRSKPAVDAWIARARELGVRGVVVLKDGREIVSAGDVAEPMRIASIRKSFISALFGIAVASGHAKLDATVGELGIDDYTLLTDVEKTATVHHLLMARSGVYIPTAAETAAMRAARPARGSHPPGTFWYYNNWDFNVLGDIYQRVTGEGLFTAIEHRLARPLGFRDFDPLKHAVWSYDRESPRFPAYNLFLSARDMALFGQLFLQRGRWKDKQIVPEAWVAESTRSYSVTGRAGAQSGYGYMWWVVSDAEGVDRRGLPAGAFTAAGNGGRYITIFPKQNLVVAVQPDEKRNEPPVKLYTQENAYSDLLRGLLEVLG